MIRMLISSFYNTIIDKEDAIPMSTMLEIDKLRNNNIIFIMSTNRTVEDVLYYNHDYPFIDYIIAYNGNCIYDVTKEKVLYQKYLTKKDINSITELFKDYKINYYKENNKVIKIEIEVSKKNCNLINKLNDLSFSKSIFIRNKKYFIEITSCDIINSITYLSKKLNVDSNEIVSVIGNLSEKEFISNIEKTYVVSNAPKELKTLTKNKTKSNNCCGVENIIKKYNK